MNTDNNDHFDLILNRQNPMLRFSVFKERYLPLLFNADPSVFNMRWIEDVAISPYLEVDLIDDFGKKVHTVPPLRRQVNSHTNSILNEVAKMAVLEAGIHVEKGKIFLENNLPRVVQFEDSRSDVIQQRWNAFLTELGYGEFLANNDTTSRKEISNSGGIEFSDNGEW